MMKILVCIKQVPDMESRFKLNASGTWYNDQDLAWRMNEYDEYAVEQAVQLREQVGDGQQGVTRFYDIGRGTACSLWRGCGCGCRCCRW